jgi:hypothetical protein
MQLDELEEKERLNSMSCENGGIESTKKAIATQVDYVALIVARTNEDLKLGTDNAEVPQHVVLDFQNKNKESTNVSHNELLSHPQAAYTIHTASGDLRHLPKRKNIFFIIIQYIKNNKKNSISDIVKRLNNRIRLDSAPTTFKDEFDYGDVNLVS